MKALEVNQVHMRGTFQVKCYPLSNQDPQYLLELILSAMKEVVRIENLLTDFRKSPFNLINEMAGIEAVHVTDEIFNLIDYSLELSKDSNGAFDISTASIGHLWRKNISNTHVEIAKELVDYKKIKLDYYNKTVFLPLKEMRIGLGGIGKGYAVDQLYNKLFKFGLRNFFVNGAGDIRVQSEKNASRAWRIGIRNPFNIDSQVTMGYLQLYNGAIATSGDYIKRWQIGNKIKHHIINPKTCDKSEGVTSVTVFSEKAIVCDTAATIVMAIGKKNGINYLNNNNLSGFFIDYKGQVHHSNNSIKAIENKYHELRSLQC